MIVEGEDKYVLAQKRINNFEVYKIKSLNYI
jgi:hypothetical protein